MEPNGLPPVVWRSRPSVRYPSKLLDKSTLSRDEAPKPSIASTQKGLSDSDSEESSIGDQFSGLLRGVSSDRVNSWTRTSNFEMRSDTDVSKLHKNPPHVSVTMKDSKKSGRFIPRIFIPDVDKRHDDYEAISEYARVAAQTEEDELVSRMITADDMRPDLKAAAAMQAALREVQTCKELFDGWAANTDSLNRKKAGTERDLANAIDALRNDAHLAVFTSHQLLSCHESFAKRMEALLSSALDSNNSNSSHNSIVLPHPTDVLEAGDDLVLQADLLSNHISTMTDRLDYAVRLMDKIKRESERRNFWGRIWRWLVKALHGLAIVLTAAALVVPLLTPYGIVVATTLVTGVSIASAAASICKEFETDAVGDEQYKELVSFLRNTVPQQVKLAQHSLMSFRACKRVMDIEMAMNRGELLRMGAEDAEEALNMWKAQRQVLQQTRTVQ